MAVSSWTELLITNDLQLCVYRNISIAEVWESVYGFCNVYVFGGCLDTMTLILNGIKEKVDLLHQVHISFSSVLNKMKAESCWLL